jgi:MFS family permease
MSRAVVTALIAAGAAYIMAVVFRTALGVAGVEALDRFGIEATALSFLAVAQIAVYAGMQVPAGLLQDKFGPRTMIVAGLAVMSVGQALMAFSDDYLTAVAARLLIGLGDAPIFIAACRLIADNVPPRRAPMLVQVTGVTGQLGQLATAVPVAMLLHARGWTSAFAILAVLGASVAAAAWFGIGATGGRPARPTTADAAAGPTSARDVWRIAGVRLGFWTHFTGLFSFNTFALLWGVPWLIQGQGMAPTTAATLLVVPVIAKLVMSPIAARWTTRHPLRRSWMVLAFAVIVLVAWAWVLLPSEPLPRWQLIAFLLVLGAGGPVSLIGMDYARTFGAGSRLGTATGFANTGGFASTIIAVLLVGVVLQAVSPPGTTEYSLDHYRIAFAALIIPWTMGVVGVVRNRTAARVAMAEGGVVVPPVRDAIRRTWGW